MRVCSLLHKEPSSRFVLVRSFSVNSINDEAAELLAEFLMQNVTLRQLGLGCMLNHGNQSSRQRGDIQLTTKNLCVFVTSFSFLRQYHRLSGSYRPSQGSMP